MTSKYTKRDAVIYDILLPTILFLFQTSLFTKVTISGYKRTFLLVKTILTLMNSVKIILVFHKGKFISDLIRLVDTVWIINLLLIILTDPEVNTPKRKNLIIFYEVYFRYLEYHILMLVYQLVHSYKNIDIETQENLYTTSAIVGKDDSLRISVILIFAHYYFPLVNGIAYSLKYWIGLTSLIPAIKCVRNFRERKMKNVYIFFIITVFWNLGTYIIALYLSAPNVGDGSEENIMKN